MDDLLNEFLTETSESLDTVDNELIRFEQDPNNAKILGNIFRLVHTIKGTCGFLGLPRLEALTHAAETLMGKFRDGMPVTGHAVTLILLTIDQVKCILAELEANQTEPNGDDQNLIDRLNLASEGSVSSDPVTSEQAAPVVVAPIAPVVVAVAAAPRPGEVSLEELERAFLETAVECDIPTSVETAVAIVAQAQTPTPNAANATVEPPVADNDRIASQSIRVNVDTLEHLMAMVSELVLTRNQLLELNRRSEDSNLKVSLQRLSNVTAELQDGVMKTRMQPIGNAWQKIPRIVRDLCGELGKKIELELHGADTELDRQVLDLIKDPLTHMVRNSADHGLETPAERLKAGKPEQGTIRVSAFHEGGHIVVCIADDGRGLNTQRIKEKAIANGLATEAEIEKMSDSQIHKFIFAPGFSTAAAVTSVSGRGVGMDVVRTNIDQIGGTIEVQSVAGEGSSVTIKIPLTLAIISALIVEAAGDRFAIPQLAIVELVHVGANSEHRIERIKDTMVLRLRERLLPLVHLSTLLRIDGGAAVDLNKSFIVVMQIGNQTFGLVVDCVFQTDEIVVKPMCTKLRHISMFSGNTILGDGSVILIVDPNGIAKAIGRSVSGHASVVKDDDARADAHDPMTSLLLFRAGSQQAKAVPLALVTRIEEVPVERIEVSNGRYLVQYRGQLMPLVLMDGTEIATSGVQSILVFADESRSMGLAVDTIVDIVEERLHIEVASNRDGILGSAVVKSVATEVVDVAHYLPMAFSDWFNRSEMTPSFASQSLLLVDDSAFFRNMLAPVLKAAGYRVQVASSAQDGLVILRSGTFNAVVTDVEMPDMNGYEFAETIRAEKRFESLPIIGLSAMTSQAAIERGRQAGFYDYVAKFDRPGLIAALKEQTSVGKAA